MDSPDQASARTAQVLLVDDELDFLQPFARSLKRRNPQINFIIANSAHAALDVVVSQSPEVAIVDLTIDPKSGPQSGLELITAITLLDSTIRVIVLTGHDSGQLGISALQRGAANFINKPVDIEHLLVLILDAAGHSQLKRNYQNIKSKLDDSGYNIGVHSKSRSMDKAIELAAYAASNRQPILLVGETGTGKGVLARCIHRHSSNHKGKFIRLQPRFGSHDMTASELFGHKKGAFTGALSDRRGLIEEAHNGTLFIDEVDELSQESQVTLLDVLQEKVFHPLGSNKQLASNFRLISATNRPLEEIKCFDRLRADFFHRINHITIEIPPLRERREDIIDLAEQFLQHVVVTDNLQVQGFDNPALGALLHYNWPGNIRELQAKVEGAVHMANFQNRRFVDITNLSLASGAKNAVLTGNQTGLSFREQIRTHEENIVRKALKDNGDNQSLAARSLQMDRSSFRRVLQRIKT